MAKEEKRDHVVIDAKDGIMGRIASYAAKQVLLGKKVDIVNCEETMISGKKNVLVSTYHAKIARGGTAQKGPFIKRTSEGIFKRAVRGMLPWSRSRGREAFRRVKCYSDVPAELMNSEKVSFKTSFYKPYVVLKDLVKLI